MTKFDFDIDFEYGINIKFWSGIAYYKTHVSVRQFVDFTTKCTGEPGYLLCQGDDEFLRPFCMDRG